MGGFNTIPNDTTTQLALGGAAGDLMDESAPPYPDGVVRKRARCVIAGDQQYNAIIDPIDRTPFGYEFALPTREMTGADVLTVLLDIRDSNRQIVAQLAQITEIDLEGSVEDGDY